MPLFTGISWNEHSADEPEPDDWEPGSIEKGAELAIHDLVRLKGFEPAREFIADILNREADNRRPRK